MRDLAIQHPVVGFGEIGLDFYRDLSPRHIQETAFENLIELGASLKLPLIIHDRDAHEQIYQALAKARSRLCGGVIHCFSGDYNLAQRFVDLGFYISIPGTITFKNAETLRRAVAGLPLDVLLLETDSPYLAPEPRRGKRNEPALVRYTAAEVARVKAVPLEEVAAATTANVKQLFNLDLAGGTAS